MKVSHLLILGCIAATAAFMSINFHNAQTKLARPIIRLPQPHYDSNISLEKILLARRSIRNFINTPLSEENVAQLLWATQGITSPQGFRTAPSAGGIYPLEVYVVTNVGLYRYLPKEHALEQISTDDLQKIVWQNGLKQKALLEASAIFVICGDFNKTAAKYGKEAKRYVLMEAGHAAQNLLLQATSLNLGSVIIGAFNTKNLGRALNIPAQFQPLTLIAVGQPKLEDR